VGKIESRSLLLLLPVKQTEPIWDEAAATLDFYWQSSI
jgi:hypothetical protein